MAELLLELFSEEIPARMQARAANELARFLGDALKDAGLEFKTVRPFVTHLPRYSLAVAAGKFLENQEVFEEDWEEAPPGLSPTPAMFVARIVGRSMEPRIPDGSLCVFRAGVTGSREGRLVLVEYLGGGTNDRYTVKVYHSIKVLHPDGTWQHDAIQLRPLNPEFEAWELTPEENRFRIVAEFVQVLY